VRGKVDGSSDNDFPRRRKWRRPALAAGLGVQPHADRGGDSAGRAPAEHEPGRPPAHRAPGRRAGYGGQEDGGRGLARHPTERQQRPAPDHGRDDPGGLPLPRRRGRRRRRGLLRPALAAPVPAAAAAAAVRALAAAARGGRRAVAECGVPRRAQRRVWGVPLAGWRPEARRGGCRRGGEDGGAAAEANDQEPRVGGEVTSQEAGWLLLQSIDGFPNSKVLVCTPFPSMVAAWQAYTHELENKVARLEEENERLRKLKVNFFNT
jgi:hypothetical protein